MSNKPVTTGAETKDSKKLGVFSTAMIGIAFAISLNLFSAGTSYTASFSRSLIAIFITWIALAAVWILFGLMGQMTGRSAADIYRFSFGSKGYKIPSAIIVVCTVFWALFDYWYVGAAVRNMMPNNPDLGFAIGMLTCSFVVVQQAYALAKIPKKFVTFAQPIFACVMAFVLEYLADITIISTWLSVISAVYGPLIGLLWAEFYVVRKTHLSDAEVHPGFSKSGIITLIVGFLLCVYLTYFAPFASPVALVGIAFGFIVQIILRKGFKLS